MPARNAQSFIEAAIASVQAQTHADWELWVVDDGSTDATAAIVRDGARRDGRIHLLQHDRSRGVCAARNQAIEAARGEFIAFLDADDVWLPHKLERQLAALRAQGAAACCSAYDVMDVHGRVLPGTARRPPTWVQYEPMLHVDRIGTLTMLYSQARLGKRTMPAGAPQEDYVAWLALLREHAGVVLGLAETLAHYRVGHASLSSAKWHAARRQWRVYREVLALPLPAAWRYFLSYATHGLIQLLRIALGRARLAWRATIAA